MLKYLPRLRWATAALVTALASVTLAPLAKAQANLYVFASNPAGTVSVFLTKADGTLTPLTTIPSGVNPTGIVVSDDNRFAYVANTGYYKSQRRELPCRPRL